MKKIIVTGAGGGLGKAICERSVNEGLGVIAVDINAASLKEIEQLPNCQTSILDISHYNDTQQFFNQLKDDPTIIGLVNNAGIYKGESLLDYNEAMMDTVLNVNIKGPTICSKFFIENLQLNNQKGKIINISSISGQEGSSDALYGLSKAAIIGLTKSLALRFFETVLVNTVAPTMIETKMMEKIPTWRKEEYYAHHLIKEAVSANDVANTVNFLLSDESNHYTGATFDLNNGGYLR
ncbi:3-oxoacyl-[acyl-carrier protein] reductase [Enterococcus rotai]|uniref:3-ketoacyl-ACP reductase n=1 Tax=Enterococcus rotai TaxID=118060 RepID=A0A0U2MXZ3_9ENTE|nr:SDR family oxidoreductase [Enterococcus rotai]ALS37763.1 3-ketoacyl-ACP reductase [Enterococcus rotai]